MLAHDDPTAVTVAHRTTQPDAVPVTLAQRIRRKSGVFWMEFMYFWTDHFPPVVLATKPFFLFMAWRTSKWLKHGTLANARRILGPQSTMAQRVRLAKRVLNHFYLSIYELGRCLRMSPKRLAGQVESVEGSEHYDAARAMQKGAIIVTAHLGPFELGMASLIHREERIHVIFQRDLLGRFDSLRTRLRAKLGAIEHPVDPSAGEHTNWQVWIAMREALLHDEIVMIQGDRLMPGQRGVPVPFTDGHILVPTGPVKLALATGAPIIPIFSIRTASGKVAVFIEPAIVVAADQGPINEHHPVVLQLSRIIERHVLAHPDQWLMVRPAWCEDMDTPTDEQ